MINDLLALYPIANQHSSTEKLAHNLNDKIMYVLNYGSLKLYLKLKINHVKIHSKFGSNRILILRQQNEKKLCHPFCKIC